MDKIVKLLRMAFHIIIFFIAITLLFVMFDQFHVLVEQSAKKVAGENLMYEATPFDTKAYTTKGELISLLMEELEYDLEVIGELGTYTIVSEDYNPSKIGLYSFTSAKYEKSYRYFLNGAIAKIVFQSVTE